jgi:hypothetical protein
MKLNIDELDKDWEEGFYDGDWDPHTLNTTEDEEEFLKEMRSFLPRHMPVYDWNTPYAEAILLHMRRLAAKSSSTQE